MITLQKKQIGASLIEVMIAVVIVGFGLLGMAGLQTLAASMGHSSYFRGVAADLGADLAERIRAVRSPYLASADANPVPPKTPDFSKCVQDNDNSPNCQNQDADRAGYQNLVNSEMTEWNQLRISQLPPGSTYTLTSSPSGSSDFFRYKLILTWVDDRTTNNTGTYTVVIE